jgi:hypothetical protein
LFDCRLIVVSGTTTRRFRTRILRPFHDDAILHRSVWSPVPHARSFSSKCPPTRRDVHYPRRWRRPGRSALGVPESRATGPGRSASGVAGSSPSPRPFRHDAPAIRATRAAASGTTPGTKRDTAPGAGARGRRNDGVPGCGSAAHQSGARRRGGDRRHQPPSRAFARAASDLGTRARPPAGSSVGLARGILGAGTARRPVQKQSGATPSGIAPPEGSDRIGQNFNDRSTLPPLSRVSRAKLPR